MDKIERSEGTKAKLSLTIPKKLNIIESTRSKFIRRQTIDMSNAMVSLEFTEDMHGFCNFYGIDQDFGRDDLVSYQKSLDEGEKKALAVKFRLTIKIFDIDSFVSDPSLTADATGQFFAEPLGGEIELVNGTFNLFVQPRPEQSSQVAREMHYTLYLRNQKGALWTFYGYKTIYDGGIDSVWQQTTTLYSRFWEGHSALAPEKIVGQGILNLNAEDFARQLTTFRSSGPDLLARARALTLFTGEFMRHLWGAYAPSLMQAEPALWSQVTIPVHTDKGVAAAAISTHSFDTDDGLTLNLQRFHRHQCNDVVILMHGLTTSTDMFIMPEHKSIVQYLLDEGFSDVWSFDWRGSSRYSYNLEPHRFNLDDVALQDVPRALQTVRASVGEAAHLHIIAHCVGGLGCMMSLSLQTFKGLESVIINSVGLTPRVGLWSRIKLKAAPFLVEKILRYPYISPRMPQFPGFSLGKWLVPILGLWHRECRNPACHFISFMWGSGHPAAYQHQNMSVLTHNRLADLFGGTSMNYYRHISKMVGQGSAVPMRAPNDPGSTVPKNYLDAFCELQQPRMLLTSGKENHIFPGANRYLYEELKRRKQDNKVEYWEIPDYGHQDVFMGQHAARDIFPKLVAFLRGKAAKL